MNLNDHLHIGQPLVLEVPSDGRQETTPYQSRLMAIDEDALIVSMPKRQGTIVPLPEGTPLHVVITQDDAIYDFDSAVIGEWEEFPPALMLAVPDEIQRTQRRDFVRVPAEIPMVLLGEHGLRIEAKTWDLSGGGLSFLHAGPVRGPVTLLVQLPKDDEQAEMVEVAGSVMRSQNYGARYLVGVRFTDLKDATREKIIAYLFKRMRELRNRP